MPAFGDHLDGRRNVPVHDQIARSDMLGKNAISSSNLAGTWST